MGWVRGRLMIFVSRAGSRAFVAGICSAVVGPVLAADMTDRLSFGGLVEVEVNAGEIIDRRDSADPIKSAGDVRLATVELTADAKVTDKVTAHLLLLHEDDATEPMEVDEGTIRVDLAPETYLNVGRMYVPFGAFETNMISDPFTLMLAQMREAAVQFGAQSGPWNGSVYIFNGDTIKTSTAERGDDPLQHFGAKIGFAVENDNYALDLGAGYVNSIGDSNSMQQLLVATTLEHYVAGYALNALYKSGPVSVIAEYIHSDQFKVGELNYQGQGAEPVALNVELGYSFLFDGKASGVAIGYQATDESVALPVPKAAILVGLSHTVFDNTTLKLELNHFVDYDRSEGGSGRSATMVTAQLGVTF